MFIKFWGVRGSIPVPGNSTLKYGGNTACIQLTTNDNNLIIFDAGTGIRNLGLELAKSEKPNNIHILFSHYHPDHIQGFPFFTPIYKERNNIILMGPTQAGLESHFSGVKDVIESLMDGVIFPFRRGSLEYLSTIKYENIGECEFSIGDAIVKTMAFNHTIYNLAYRVESKGKSVIYAGDHEPYQNIFASDKEESKKEVGVTRIYDAEQFVKKMNERIQNFILNANIFICDSQYTEKEYKTYKGWGHSSMNDAVKLAISANVKQLILTHHEPRRSDEELDKLEIELQKLAREKLNSALQISFAKEGDVFKL